MTMSKGGQTVSISNEENHLVTRIFRSYSSVGLQVNRTIVPVVIRCSISGWNAITIEARSSGKN
jgi:hypothetical protein